MASNNFGGTVIGGIQDISALLPLLGTEQCEEHVGSALDKGFLYSSVTPLSIFGSLGIVRASFNILVASLSIRRFRFLGAKKLEDGGFSSKGVVAPMIALDRDQPKRFLAESRLEAMLTDEHIENVEDLTVSWGPRIFWWNLMLVLCTIIFSTLGLLPYLSIILSSRHPTGRPLLPSGWGFPIFRVLGSALCVNAAQFVIQLRVLIILKTRLLFVTIDRLAKVENIDIASSLNTENHSEKERKHPWSSDVASETCIWALERWLNTSSAAIDPESNSEKAVIRSFYNSEFIRHFDKMERRIPPWLHPVLCLILVIGTIMTIGGYIGCFYLIQHTSNTSIAPAVWLALEALLSIVRILVWALNPSWDDSKGIVFDLKLASHAPLITCSRFQKDMEDDRAAPVTRSNNFLEEVVAYKGPLPVFSWSDVALYYIFTAKDKSPPIVDFPTNITPHGILYIILFDYKEQTSRMVVKNGNSFLIYICSLEFAPGDTAITVRVDLSNNGVTQLKTHSFTANARFMKELMLHYDTIATLLQKTSKSNNLFGKTWALFQPEEEKENPEHPDAEQKSLTPEDNTYLRQGQLERRWKDLFKRLEEWMEVNIALYIKELLQDVPVDLVFKADESVTLVQKYEANEVEYLFIEYRICMERLLMSTAKKWDEFVAQHHRNMVETVLKGTFVVGMAEQHGEKIRRGKLESRLVDEWKSLFDAELREKDRNWRKRVDSQAISTNQRILGRRYYDPVGATISGLWKELPERLAALAPLPSPTEPPNESRAPSSPSTVEKDEKDSFHSSEESVEKSSSVDSEDVSEVDDTQPETKELGEILDFKNEFETRLRTGDTEISNMPTDRPEALKAKKDVYGDFELMKKRCRDRFDLFVSRMDHQREEFDELSIDIRSSSTLDESNILTADSHNEAVYWSNSSIRERHRLTDRSQQYLELTDDSILAVGGPKNMVRVLKRSQNYVVIDFSRSKRLSGSDALQIVKDVKSITGVWWTRDEQAEEIFDAVLSNVTACFQREEFACFYRNVNVTDYYRRGRPYLIFHYPSHSLCTVYIRVHQEQDHIITINHCMTTSRAVVDIALNDEALERTWGLPTSRTIDDFHKEDILLPKRLLSTSSANELVIKLADTSPGVYWLSDMKLSVVREPIPTGVNTHI